MALLDLLKRVKKKADDTVRGVEKTSQSLGANARMQVNKATSNVNRTVSNIEKKSQNAGESARRVVNKAATSPVANFVKDVPKLAAAGFIGSTAIYDDTLRKIGDESQKILLGKEARERADKRILERNKKEQSKLDELKPKELIKGQGVRNYLKDTYNQALPQVKGRQTANTTQRIFAPIDIGLTLASLGGKSIIKEFAKGGIKAAAKAATPTVIEGALGGAASALTEKDVTAQDVATRAGAGALFGVGGNVVGDAGSAVVKSIGSGADKATKAAGSGIKALAESTKKSLQQPKFQPGFIGEKGNKKISNPIKQALQQVENKKSAPVASNRIGDMLPKMDEIKPKAKSTSPQIEYVAKTGNISQDAADKLIKKYGGDKAEIIVSKMSDKQVEGNRDAYAFGIAKKEGIKPVEPTTKPGLISKQDSETLAREALASITEDPTQSKPSKIKLDIEEAKNDKIIDKLNERQKRSQYLEEITKDKESIKYDKIIDRLNERQKRSQDSELLARKALETSVPEPVKPEIAPVARVFTKDDVSIPETSKQSRLGSIADDFEQANKGNKKVTFRDWENLGAKIEKQIDTDLESIGSNYSDIAKKVQSGQRSGIKKLEDAGLSKQEADIIRKAQAEMGYVRKRAAVKGIKQIGEGDLGEMYLPQRKENFDTRESLLTEFRTKKPGSEFKRENKIALEDLDTSTRTVADYITRYGDTKLFKQEGIARALQRENPSVDVKSIQKATTQFIKLQDEINSIKTKVNLGGLGTKAQVNAQGVKVDSAKVLSGIGDTLGLEKQVIVGQPKGLTIEDRVDSVGIKGVKLGDIIGLNQYRNAETFGSAQFTQAGGDRAKLSQAIRTRLEKDYNLSQGNIEYLTKRFDNVSPAVGDDVVKATAINIYRTAAKQQIINQLQRLELKNPELQRNVSELVNQILREGSIENEVSAKAVSAILTTQDALFRRVNPSSAINELSDLPSFASVYGKDFLTSIVPDFKLLKEFGLGEIDAAIEPYIRQVGKNKGGLMGILSKINDASKLYKFVETYKAALVATASKKSNVARGLSGDDLTKAVLNEYRQLALPVDAFTKTALDNLPLFTQYLTWGIRNLQKEKRLALGEISVGNLQDMSQVQRAMRNAYVNLPAKTVLWLSTNALKGTAILTAFGLTDFTGITSEDFSGIQEEDKTLFNKITKYTNISTTASILASIVESYQKEQLKEKYKDEDYNPYEFNNLGKDLLNKYTPAIIRNVRGTTDLLEKGYSENKAGRVQFEAPTTVYDKAKGFLFGKGNTEKARDNAGTASIFGREGNPLKNIRDMALEQLNFQDTNYSRPLTKEYSERYKAATKENRPELFKGGKAFNAYLDNLKRNNPDDYNTYIKSLDGNHVNPEYWGAVSSGQDMLIFKTLRDRYKQKYKDLGVKYDPIYNLSDEQAKAVLQQKSTATGEDLALRNALYKEGWYRDYMKDTKAYYADRKPVDASEKKQTDRVKQWYELSDQYNNLRNINTDDGKQPEWAKQYPLVYQSKAINDKYGFDSQESKNFYKNNSNAYKAQKALYDAENLELINQMRAIEGVPPLGEEAYSQVTNIKNTSGGSGSSGSRSSRSGSSRKNIEKTIKVKGDLELLRLKNKPKIQISKLTRKNRAIPKTIKIKGNKPKKITFKKIKISK